MLTIHGVPFSAHTRKVIVTALEKGIDYQLNKVIPLAPPPGWQELSPLGLIPVIEDDGFTLADSSAICAYLERKHPTRAIYPAETRQFARALWIEEFVDGGLVPHVLRGLLMQRVFAPKFLNQAPDTALIHKSLTEMIPPRLAYLEKELAGKYFAGDAFSIADIAVASILLNYHYAGESLDGGRYPRLRGWLHDILARECFKRALAIEAPAAESVGGLDMTLLRSLGY